MNCKTLNIKECQDCILDYPCIIEYFITPILKNYNDEELKDVIIAWLKECPTDEMQFRVAINTLRSDFMPQYEKVMLLL